MHEILGYIHTEFILTGVAGGALHILYERKVSPFEVVRNILASALLANFITPAVLFFAPTVPETGAGTVAFILGYGTFRFCRYADKYIDNLNTFEGS